GPAPRAAEEVVGQPQPLGDGLRPLLEAGPLLPLAPRRGQGPPLTHRYQHRPARGRDGQGAARAPPRPPPPRPAPPRPPPRRAARGRPARRGARPRGRPGPPRPGRRRGGRRRRGRGSGTWPRAPRERLPPAPSPGRRACTAGAPSGPVFPPARWHPL